MLITEVEDVIKTTIYPVKVLQGTVTFTTFDSSGKKRMYEEVRRIKVGQDKSHPDYMTLNFTFYRKKYCIRISKHEYHALLSGKKKKLTYQDIDGCAKENRPKISRNQAIRLDYSEWKRLSRRLLKYMPKTEDTLVDMIRYLQRIKEEI